MILWLVCNVQVVVAMVTMWMQGEIEQQSPVVSCFPCSPLVTVHVVLSCLSSFSPVFPLSPPHTHTCTFHTQYILPHCQVTVSLIWVTHFSCYCLTHLATNAWHNLASHKVGLSMFVENRNNHVPFGVGALPLDIFPPNTWTWLSVCCHKYYYHSLNGEFYHNVIRMCNITLVWENPFWSYCMWRMKVV